MHTTITERASFLDRPMSEQSTRKFVGGLVLVALTAWGLTVYLSTQVAVDNTTHLVALAVHIVSMAAAFGVVLLVDWHGFLWLLRRRRISETIRLDGAATPLIWGGLGGMTVSGVFLSPDLTSGLTVTKLAAVLILTVNGILLIPLMRRLVQLPPTTTFGGLPMGQRIHMLLGASISQAAWWTAILVGFVNASS